MMVKCYLNQSAIGSPLGIRPVKAKNTMHIMMQKMSESPLICHAAHFLAAVSAALKITYIRRMIPLQQTQLPVMSPCVTSEVLVSAQHPASSM